jgi:hypothetical protein
MTGDCHVRFGERLAGKFRRPTHLDLRVILPDGLSGSAQKRMLSQSRLKYSSGCGNRDMTFRTRLPKPATRIATLRSYCRTSPCTHPTRRYVQSC